MPKELNPEEFEAEIAANLTPEAREWVARLLHDHVSGLITSLTMHVEILKKMIEREMDIEEELASLRQETSEASQHIKMIEMTIRPKADD